MKLSETPVKQFQPISLTITFESKEELEALWHRMNLGSGTIGENTSGKNRVPFSREKDSQLVHHLWTWVDKTLENLK